MAFRVHPSQEFLVRPSLPAPLARLWDMAYNLLWTWDVEIRNVFRRLDTELWENCGHNPAVLLGEISQARLEQMASDQRYLLSYKRACERFDAYLRLQESGGNSMLVAYFSMEYGLAESIPIYSGGLGLLAGDHLRAASDLGMNLVGVGLLYQRGYFQQQLNPDGWQIERFPVNDFYMMPLKPVLDQDGAALRISVELPHGPVHLKVWQLDVGRVKLYLLDSNIAENVSPLYRDITAQLYGGDDQTRLLQEIVLGIGGMRALRALGIHPTVFHMNEGHSAFLALERIRTLMQEHNLSFSAALQASRNNNVFTTHTSVPAGIDLFEVNLLYEQLHTYCQQSGIAFEDLLSLGRRTAAEPHERFSMAVCALKTSSYRNAVSRLHRRVSQQMWQGLWSQLPSWEVPVTSVTNGVHLLTWLNADLAALYDHYLEPGWRENHDDPRVWEMVEDIPASELWEIRRRRKRRLIDYIRARVREQAIARKASSAEIHRMREVLDPDVFTIGFARRFASYKRPKLLLTDIERLRRLLLNQDRPVQIIIAGKAHPKDHPGKGLLREVALLARDPELCRRLVFVEDYGIRLGRELVRGVDLWLNTPRRGEEACGTSGMKAAMNGVLNLSILDGWFDEAFEISGGWAIGYREAYSEDQDPIHASSIYSLLENEIVPIFYERRDGNVPQEWMRRVKKSLSQLTPLFNAQRMMDDYRVQLYEPAHRACVTSREKDHEDARERERWNTAVAAAWPGVHFRELGLPLNGPVLVGRQVTLRAEVHLAGLKPADVKVEAVVGRISPDGTLQEAEVIILPPAGEQGEATVFSAEYVPQVTGRLGYAMRISPNHYDDPLTRPCESLIKWG